jgi:hypothetical protein
MRLIEGAGIASLKPCLRTIHFQLAASEIRHEGSSWSLLLRMGPDTLPTRGKVEGTANLFISARKLDQSF